MSNQITITLSSSTLKDRLRILAEKLTNENSHTDALLVDMAIQAIGQVPAAIPMSHETICDIVAQNLKFGVFDDALTEVVRRMSMPLKNTGVGQ